MPKTLVDSDITRAASEIGCLPAAIRAVLSVESNGHGFAPDGRPIILFEPQVFSRLTGHKFDVSHPQLSSPTWNRNLYPASQGGRWLQLGEAAELDHDAAYKAASYGLFQILGQNYAACGFSDVNAYVAAMRESEGRHLDAFVSFVKSEGLADELRDQRWTDFARRYNGPGYRGRPDTLADDYDLRLAAAFKKAQGAP